MLKIAIASGKGGTGKTTVAAALAQALSEKAEVWYLDCDVEAPNGHLFLKPVFEDVQPAAVLIPQIDAQKCNLCGQCVEVCQFHALAKVGGSVLVFQQLCHGCGSCTLNCPRKAISEIPHAIGTLETGRTPGGMRFWRGVLTVSEPMPTPVIRQLKRAAVPPQDAVVVLDSPPGASCAVVETLRGADFALLVTEPTPFGLHDLKQILAIVREMQIPCGVVINRDGMGDDLTDAFLAEAGLPVLLRIPYNRSLAAGLASGRSLLELDAGYRPRLLELFERIRALAEGKPA